MTTIAKNKQFKKMDFIGKIGVVIGIAVSLFMAIFLLFSILLMTVFNQSDTKIEFKKVIFFGILQLLFLIGAICNIVFSILYINQKAGKLFVGVMNIIFAAVVPGILIIMEDVVPNNSDKKDDTSIIPKEIQPGKLTHLGSILGLFINTIMFFLFAFFMGYYVAVNHRFEIKDLVVATVISLFMLGVIINIVFTILYLKGRISKKLVAVFNIIFALIAPGILIMFSNEFAEHKAQQNAHKNK